MNDSLEEIEGYIKGENSVEYMKKTSADPYKTGRDEDPLSSAGHCPYAACHKKIFKWQSNTVENVPGKIFR